jgi:serine/threonine-protein kinase
MTIAPGENVGPYRIIEQLGSGGMATVFKAYHASLDRYVAIKVLHPAFKADPQFFERFKREARIVAKLEHPHIIPIYDFNEHKGEPYLVMRFIEGDTLKPTLTGQPMPPQQMLQLMRPVCQALAYAHQQGVLHRDIKPSNIMVTKDGNVFLTDFGLARMVQAGESTLSQDMLVGTPQYISPEQAQGVKELDGRTDIYSLGVVLFEMCTGRVPFNADTPFATIHNHIYAPLPLPSAINPSIDPAVERLLLKALAKEPEDRFATATDLLSLLETTLAPQLTLASIARPEAKSSPPQVAPKKGWPWWGWAGAILAVILVGLILAGLLIRGARNRNAQAEPKPAATQAAKTDRDDSPAAAPVDQAQPAEPTTAPTNAIDLTEQANRALRQNQVEEAIALYKQAIAADPHYIPAYLGLSAAQNRNGNSAGAVETLEEAVANNPQNPAALLRLGEAQLLLADDPEAALASFQEAAEIEPHAALAQAGQAIALLALDQNEEAKHAIDAALALDSNSPEAHLANAIYLSRQGNRLQALREFRWVIQNQETSPLLKDRARRLMEQFD